MFIHHTRKPNKKKFDGICNVVKINSIKYLHCKAVNLRQWVLSFQQLFIRIEFLCEHLTVWKSPYYIISFYWILIRDNIITHTWRRPESLLKGFTCWISSPSRFVYCILYFLRIIYGNVSSRNLMELEGYKRHRTLIRWLFRHSPFFPSPPHNSWNS